MAKFHGLVGYVENIETKPGVWVGAVREREYFGDVIRESRQWVASQQTNENLQIANRISIVADDFAWQNFSAMRYVIWLGVSWKVSSVEIQKPRIILTLGGKYNGPKT